MEQQTRDAAAQSARRSYAALAALVGVLLLNDFVLKPTFGNVVTGKLSDFAGVAAFGLFGVLMLPRRRNVMLVGTALCFTFWKSPGADGFIAALNGVLPYTVGRTVDWWDLLGLCTLVPVWWLTRTFPAQRLPLRHGWQYAVVALSVFSFAATADTMPTDVDISRSYTFNASSDSLKALLRTAPDSVEVRYAEGTYLTLVIPWTCPFGLVADIRVLGSASTATLWLDRLSSHCPRDGWRNADLHWLFERKVIHPLIEHVGPATPG